MPSIFRRQGALSGVTTGAENAGKSGYNSLRNAASGLSTGQIAGAIVAIIIGFVLICAMLYCLCIRRLKHGRSRLNASEYDPLDGRQKRKQQTSQTSAQQAKEMWLQPGASASRGGVGAGAGAYQMGKAREAMDSKDTHVDSPFAAETPRRTRFAAAHTPASASTDSFLSESTMATPATPPTAASGPRRSFGSSIAGSRR
ncbi:unnamed protein product [Jaminaea pallidilutea]